MNKEDVLAAIAENYLAAARRGKPPSPDYYVRKCPEFTTDIRELLDSLNTLEKFSHNESARRQTERAKTIRHDQIPSPLGEFDLEHELGRGGMGTVFLASDKMLDRKVALKVMRKSADTTDSSVRRFEREAQLASRLHHTNIVPVFGAGSDKGFCFYAMQFIEAVDLRKVITLTATRRQQQLPHRSLFEEAHEAITKLWPSSTFARAAGKERNGDAAPRSNAREIATIAAQKASPGGAAKAKVAYYRSIAKIGYQVCDALAYAHASGITHRDIKPSNLLIDGTETVWIADFGLAKLDDDEEMTATGNIVGTLRYMAPEQFAGSHHPVSDVYSVGLTLYELVALTPAHQDSRYAAMTEQIHDEQLEPLHTHEPDIPRDLETIILTATQPRIENRYTSAKHMREDLYRFLNDQPILARRSTKWEHFSRLCRKHRAIAALVALLTVMVAGLPIMLGLAYKREADERKRAEATLNVALEGFNELYSAFVERNLVDFDLSLAVHSVAGESLPIGPTPGTRQFLNRMLNFYDRLAEQTSGNDNLLRESAFARRRVAAIHRALGQHDDALSSYSEAGELLESLAQRSGEDFRTTFAELHIERGRILKWMDEGEAASEEFQQALQAIDPVPTTNSSVEARFLLALCFRELEPPGVFDESSQTYRSRAYQILKSLVAEYPTESRYRFELAQTLRDVDPHHLDSSDVPRAIEQLNQARGYSEQLIAQSEPVAVYHLSLAHIYSNLGLLYTRQSAWSSAEVATRKAVETHRCVVDDFPGLAETSQQLVAGPTLSLAEILLRTERPNEAGRVAAKLAGDLRELQQTESLSDLARVRVESDLQACDRIMFEALR